MVGEPRVAEEKLYVAEPFERAREEVSVVPSTTMVKVPVGVVVVELDAEVTVIEMVSPAPGAGVMVAAERVVFEGTVPEEVEAGHAASKLLKSIEPRPEASS